MDDNAAQREVLSAYLHEWGMTVTCAENGVAALAALRAAASANLPIAVAVVDRSMAGMDGLELSAEVVADPALRARVVLLTSFGEEADLDDPAECDFSATVSKPVAWASLRSRLRTVLNVAGAVLEEAIVPPAAWTGQADRGRLLLAEDNLVNQKVAVAMLSGAGYHMETVLNGGGGSPRCGSECLRRHLDGLPDARTRRL